MEVKDIQGFLNVNIYPKNQIPAAQEAWVENMSLFAPIFNDAFNGRGDGPGGSTFSGIIPGAPRFIASSAPF
jgi:hypothetical protein